jgi:hypothetical protein
MTAFHTAFQAGKSPTTQTTHLRRSPDRAGKVSFGARPEDHASSNEWLFTMWKSVVHSYPRRRRGSADCVEKVGQYFSVEILCPD